MNEIIKKIDEEILNIEKCIADTQKQCKSLNMKCNVSHQMTTRRALEWAKGIVQAEQKEPTYEQLKYGYDLQSNIIKQLEKSNQELSDRVVKAEGLISNDVIKEKSNFDVITESPEKLAYWIKIISLSRIVFDSETGEISFNDNGLTDYFNQKAEEK